MQPTPPTKGLIRSLVDFSFSSLITTKIIKIVYVIVTIVVSLGALGFLVSFVTRGGAYVVVGIIGAPIGWLLYMIWARISLEIIIVVFHIGEDVRRIADRPGGATSSPYMPGGFPSTPASWQQPPSSSAPPPPAPGTAAGPPV